MKIMYRLLIGCFILLPILFILSILVSIRDHHAEATNENSWKVNTRTFMNEMRVTVGTITDPDTNIEYIIVKTEDGIAVTPRLAPKLDKK